MSLTFIPATETPKPQSIIVCAGTVTCHHVSHMAAGFSVFKRYFKEDIAYDDNESSWQAILNQRLTAFFKEQIPMPPFQLIAKSDQYLGGVATAPFYTGKKGLDPTNTQPSQSDMEEDYFNAVIGAIKAARHLDRPLYIQPLGIGVYGWAPEKGAELFAKAIKTHNKEDSCDITIPLFKLSANSHDQIFRGSLEKYLSS